MTKKGSHGVGVKVKAWWNPVDGHLLLAGFARDDIGKRGFIPLVAVPDIVGWLQRRADKFGLDEVGPYSLYDMLNDAADDLAQAGGGGDE